jgi:tRNA 2-thiouridine synthesizing protein A
MVKAPRRAAPRFDRELDVRGLGCPMPALRARAALGRMESGQVLRIVATDPGATRDFALFARMTGHALVAQSATRKEFVFYLRKA